MQNFRNYYDILEVAPQASLDQIKQAYRRLARKYHPDLNPGDSTAEERFKVLGEAYEVLSDPERRSQYEKFSSFWKQKGFGRGRAKQSGGAGVGTASRSEAPPRNGGFSVGDVEFGEFRDFNTFVDQLLNRRGKASSEPPRPPSAEARAAAKTDPYRTQPKAARPSKSRPSNRNGAPSRDRPSRRDAEAHLTVPLEKAFSGGQERIRLEDGRSLEVTMPPGMITGQRIRLKGQGIDGGNLYLRIEVNPHPYFKLKNSDIYCKVPLTPSEAVIGGVVEVPTLDGWVKMNIPAGVQAGQRLRLAEKGYPVGQNRRGDQIVQIEIALPTTLSDRERTLYQELRSLETYNPRADLPIEE